MQVNVVNSYAAASDSVPVASYTIIEEKNATLPVSFESKLDFPTDGKPISATRASPTLATSKPSPFAPDPLAGSRSYSFMNKNQLQWTLSPHL